jgi:hypothetical protein
MFRSVVSLIPNLKSVRRRNLKLKYYTIWHLTVASEQLSRNSITYWVEWFSSVFPDDC